MIRITRTSSDDPDFIALVRYLDADLAGRDGQEHLFYARFNKIDAITHVVVAYDNGAAVACGAIKEFAPRIMEIKRMITLPESRGKGIASRVLAELEAWAAELSYEKCILETGKRQPEAIALYKKNGYKVIPNYSPYEGVENSVCFEKDCYRRNPLPIPAKYVHTNLIAKDWRALAGFYQAVFGCTPVPPERDYQGEKLEAGSGIPGVHLWGAHLRLPGYGDDGPTLEIFNYNILEKRGKTAVNRPGYGHIAFAVEDVAAAQKALLKAGGRAVGEIVTLQTASGAKVTWCYATDPEGNIVELQSWSS